MAEQLRLLAVPALEAGVRDRARRDAVDPDPVAGDLEHEALGEAVDEELRRRVGARVGDAELAGDDVDDRARALRLASAGSRRGSRRRRSRRSSGRRGPSPRRSSSSTSAWTCVAGVVDQDVEHVRARRRPAGDGGVPGGARRDVECERRPAPAARRRPLLAASRADVGHDHASRLPRRAAARSRAPIAPPPPVTIATRLSSFIAPPRPPGARARFYRHNSEFVPVS